MALPPPPAPYHHGDLRRALLDAAHAILAETGRWDFSLREVARRAGVSHAAPYRHFVDKEALLAAIGVGGFDRLRAGTAAGAAGADGPAGTLAALGRAYIRFGLDHPGLYRLMFGQALGPPAGLPPALAEAIGLARGALRDVVLWGARERAFRIAADDPAAVATATIAAWSLVHGLTALTLDGVVGRDPGETAVDDLADRVVDLFVQGLVCGGGPTDPPAPATREAKR